MGLTELRCREPLAPNAHSCEDWGVLARNPLSALGDLQAQVVEEQDSVFNTSGCTKLRTPIHSRCPETQGKVIVNPITQEGETRDAIELRMKGSQKEKPREKRNPNLETQRELTFFRGL